VTLLAKDDRAKPIPPRTLPRMHTVLNPKRLANALTKGPGKCGIVVKFVNALSVIKQKGVYTEDIDYFWCGKCEAGVRSV